MSGLAVFGLKYASTRTPEATNSVEPEDSSERHLNGVAGTSGTVDPRVLFKRLITQGAGATYLDGNGVFFVVNGALRELAEPVGPPITIIQSSARYFRWRRSRSFGYTCCRMCAKGDLYAWCEELKTRGATFSVEPYEFNPGTVICYLAAPDGVSIEIVQARNK